MKKTSYIYRLKSKYIKEPKWVLANYPFQLFEGEDQKIMAMPIELSMDNILVQGLIKQIEFLYEKGTSEERDEWEKNGFEFELVLHEDQSTSYQLKITDDIKKDITQAEFCISLSDEDKGCLFINAPNKAAYYHYTIFGECGLQDCINDLIKDKIIYKKRIKYRDA